MTTLPAPSLDNERAFLGAILIDSANLPEVAWVGPEHFHAHHHRWIWEAITEISEGGLVSDFITVRDQLDKSGHLSECGGAAYLVRLLTEPANSQYVESYARLVERDWKRRELMAGATQLAQIAGGKAGEARDVLAGIERSLSGQGGVTDQTVNAVALDVWDAVAYPERLAARLVPTGLAKWDDALGGGLERGTLTVLMARPSMGKTAALVQVADYVSEKGGTVAVFSKEMTSRQWLLRTACRRARVSILALRQRSASDAERNRVLAEISALSERETLVLDDSAPQTTGDVLAVCRRLNRTGALSLVVADHLRLFADEGENENKRQGGISWALKRLAKSLDVPVLCAAQLNRGVEQGGDKKPDLKDLRDSGEIEENADVVTALYRDAYYTDNPLDHTAELINRKARDGERNARARFGFLPAYMSFEPLFNQEAQ